MSLFEYLCLDCGKTTEQLIMDLAERPQCAELAAGVLYFALANYRELQYSPWKKLYRKK